MEISEEIDSNELLTRDNIRAVLLVLAFVTPYLVSVGVGSDFIHIRLNAPLWMFGSLDYPIFTIFSLGYVVSQLPFGLVRLAFIRQVLLYKKNLTAITKLVTIGILCELPGLILYMIFPSNWCFFPFPIFLFAGLLLAKYTTKDPLSWLEKESGAH